MSMMVDEPPTDYESLINDLHELQVSLSMLVAELRHAHHRQPTRSKELLQSLSSLSWLMGQQHPSLMRH